MNAVSSTTEPELRFTTVNGIELAYWERGEPRLDEPTLFFVHATGFHGRVFDRVLEAFPGFHSIALEQRGHGRSEHSPIQHWQTMGEDQIAFLREKDLSNLIGIGHSMGAHAMIDAAAATGAFARLLLLDPTVPAPQGFAEAPPPDFSQQHPAAKRKSHFDSPEDMRDRILPKGAYHLFEPRILMDYCRYGLLPSAAGGFELACLPEMEASVYQTARTNPGVYDSARALTIPVTIMRAMEPGPDRDPTDFSVSPTWPGLVTQFQNGREFHLADCTHFIPMQMPDRVVEIIQEEVSSWQADNAIEG
jgi:pimeloyl-ACP methyl ester carboxylesterase